ncbi:MAG: pilus assembly protein TadG-related protein [Alphaproteobacteria bacterium]
MVRLGSRPGHLAAAASQLRHFARVRRGDVAVWGAIMFVPLLGFTGHGVDGARGYLLKARRSQALDSAGIAAGKWSANTAEAEEEEEVLMTFKANFPEGYLGAATSVPSIAFNGYIDVVTVSATAALPTYFVHLLAAERASLAPSPAERGPRRGVWQAPARPVREPVGLGY